MGRPIMRLWLLTLALLCVANVSADPTAEAKAEVTEKSEPVDHDGFAVHLVDFDAADKDGDGSLTREEFINAPHHFKDGEARDLMQLADDFKDMDKNHNGKVSLQEYKEFQMGKDEGEEDDDDAEVDDYAPEDSENELEDSLDEEEDHWIDDQLNAQEAEIDDVAPQPIEEKLKEYKRDADAEKSAPATVASEGDAPVVDTKEEAATASEAEAPVTDAGEVETVAVATSEDDKPVADQ